MAQILVVEDDQSIREMVVTYLSFYGFETITAADGIEALMVAKNNRPDLILMDMGLPKLNGWQTTQRLRARQDTAHIPIIAVTAYALDSDRQHALNMGCDEFEPKPINFDSLLAKIQTMLDHGRVQSHNE